MTTRLRIVVALAALLVMTLLPGLAAAQDSSDGPTVVADARFAEEVSVDAPFDAHQLVLSFAPGAVAALHQHGGPGYITMLTGELTLLADDVEYTYRAGDSFVEVPESRYEGTNNTDESASLMVTYIVPPGHDVTTYINSGTAQQAPGPEIISQAMFTVEESPDEYEVVHHLLDFAPRAWSAAEEDSGRTLITVVEGQLTARDADGVETVYEAGDTRIEDPGIEHELGNAGDSPTRIVSTEFPAVGDGGSSWGWSQIGIIVASCCVGGAAGGFLVRRRRKAA